MKKLALDLEKLEVESFDTDSDGADGRGTVRGHLATDSCTQGLDCIFTDWESCYGGCSDSGCGPGQKCYTE